MSVRRANRLHILPVLESAPGKTLEACLASCFLIHPDSVPAFRKTWPGLWTSKLTEWVAKRGYKCVFSTLEKMQARETEDVSKSWLYSDDPDVIESVYIQTWRREDEKPHYTLCCDGRLIWDPALTHPPLRICEGQVIFFQHSIL